MLGNKINNIPDGWKVEHIEDFASIKTGTGDTQDREDGGKYPFFVRSNTIERVNKYTFDGEGVLTSGDGVGVGKIYHYVNGKFHYHQRVYNIHNFKPHVLGRYFYQFFSYRFFQRVSRMSAKGSVDSVRMEMIAKMSVLIPTIQEQQKIADILSTVDKKIDLIDQKIAETVKLKTGLMQKLFSEGVGVQDSDGNWQPHSEFQDSPFGKVPSSWALETLEQRLDVIKDGTHFSPKSKEGPCKYLTSKNIRFGELDLTNISYISQEEHDRIYKGSPVKYGDILLTKDGANTGNAAINTLEEPFSLLSSVAYLRGSEEDVDHGYLLQLLLSPKGQSMMKSAMAGQAITRLTLKKIGAFVLPFAPIDEQNEIERILSTVDKKLQLLKKQKSETQQLKKGLMQKLLTGEWRVPVEEAEAA
ncbi:restriction endonuclease subunit S [Vibrio parahaemolyticus]|uniref:restriction endonuclease subunit S n=2 Tax=Vibrio parahaemolyticus TaxID=670 RepID=UPI00215C949A|nr:restriction endonuclease subunit S [Vibrio parahaemolyticus]MCR9865148.1 restriction endonuclease subunit S [Vibrio parahaemolyticus]